VIAVDQRGHWRSQKTEITPWKVFGQDLAAFAEGEDTDTRTTGRPVG